MPDASGTNWSRATALTGLSAGPSASQVKANRQAGRPLYAAPLPFSHFYYPGSTSSSFARVWLSHDENHKMPDGTVTTRFRNERGNQHDAICALCGKSFAFTIASPDGGWFNIEKHMKSSSHHMSSSDPRHAARLAEQQNFLDDEEQCDAKSDADSVIETQKDGKKKKSGKPTDQQTMEQAMKKLHAERDIALAYATTPSLAFSAVENPRFQAAFEPAFTQGNTISKIVREQAELKLKEMLAAAGAAHRSKRVYGCLQYDAGTVWNRYVVVTVTVEGHYPIVVACAHDKSMGSGANKGKLTGANISAVLGEARAICAKYGITIIGTVADSAAGWVSSP